MFSSNKKIPPGINNNRKGSPSIISAGLTITGNLTSDGEVQVDGIVLGDIRAGTLSVGEGACITGEILAERVLIKGEIIGTIRANAVELAKSAMVRGDILHEVLSIEAGANVEGHCKHIDNPRESAPALTATPGTKEAKTTPAKVMHRTVGGALLPAAGE